MGETIVPFSTGTIKVSAIRFYCSQSRTDGLVVQLGAIAEILVPKLCGLGLIARAQLTPFEMEAIGELGRRLLASPFEALSKEFDLAWTTEEPIEFLRSRHSHSFRVEAPSIQNVPRRLFIDGQPVRSLVRTFLSESLDEEGQKLVALDERQASHMVKEPPERVELRPQAAA
jgi:hypothetical protein